MAMVQDLIRMNLISDLKLQPVATGVQAFVLGYTVVGDGLGGFYYWDETSTLAEDLVYLNVIISTGITTGRWIRAFQKVKTVPQGIVVSNGNFKTLYASGVTDSNGQCTLNLTTDNTPTGPSIFSTIWFNQSGCISPGSGPANAIQDYIISQNLKTTQHGYFKANAVTISLGLLYGPFAAVAAGQVVNFKIEGV